MEEEQSSDVASSSMMESIHQIKWPDKSEYSDSFEEDIWAADISKKREAQAKALADLIVVQENPCTICLNGGWGSGKTFFLTRFTKEYCKAIAKGASQHPSAIYFNAWKDDFLEDPLLSILGQITQSESLKKKLGEKLDDLKKAAKPLLAQVGLGLVKCVSKGILKKVTGVDSEDIKDVFEISLGDINSFEEQKLLDDYAEVSNSRTALHKALEELAKKNWDDTKFPLAIVIDELDRCRPLFAIELLERIKHLFDVPHVVFVLGMDVDQLKKSLKAVYGDIDAQDYLLKFLDVEITLPPLSKDNFMDYLWHRSGYDKLMLPNCPDIVYQDGDLVWKTFKLLARVCNLTLRQIEQCIRIFLFLARPYKNETLPVSAELIAGGIVLKVIDADMHAKFMDWEFKAWELVDAIVPERVSQNDLVEIRDLIGEIYKLVSSVDPMSAFRQNLTWLADNGNLMPGASKNDFDLPRFIRALPPIEWQRACKDYSNAMLTRGAVNHSYLKTLREKKERTMKVLRETFLLVGNIDEKS